MPMRTEKSAPRQTRAAEIRPASWEEETHSVEVVVSTGAVVRRYGWLGDQWDEQLEISEKAIRLGRMESGAPALNVHRSWDLGDVIGVVMPGTIRVEDSKLIARIQLSRRPEVAGIVQDIRDGIIRNVSVGYDYHVIEEQKRKGEGKVPLFIARDWEPLEVSFVPIGADAGAGVRTRAADTHHTCAVIRAEDDHVPTKNEPQKPEDKQPDNAADPVAERKAGALAQIKRGQDLRAAGKVCGILADDVQAAIDNPAQSVEEIRAAWVQRAADAQKGTETSNRSSTDMGKTDGEKKDEALTAALLHRIRPDKYPLPNDEVVRDLRRAHLLDIVRGRLERQPGRSRQARSLSRDEVAVEGLRAMTTDDFPYLLANVSNKVLLDMHQEAHSPWKEFATRKDRPDLKEFTLLQRSNAPSLKRVLEHGEIKRGRYFERKEKGKLQTAGIGLELTRELLINDDLDAFADDLLGLMNAVIRYEDDTAVGLVLSNPVMTTDNKALIHADHGNLNTDVGEPSYARLEGADDMLGSQTGMTGEPLNLSTAFVFASKKRARTAWKELYGLMVPTLASNARADDMAKIKVLSDNRLKTSEEAFFNIAHPSQIKGLFYGYLEEQQAPKTVVTTTAGFLGVILELIHDFYAAIADHRWIVRTRIAG